MFDREPLGYSGIFLDTANLYELRRWTKGGILGGATTNPKLLNQSLAIYCKNFIC